MLVEVAQGKRLQFEGPTGLHKKCGRLLRNLQIGVARAQTNLYFGFYCVDIHFVE